MIKDLWIKQAKQQAKVDYQKGRTQYLDFNKNKDTHHGYKIVHREYVKAYERARREDENKL